MEAAVQSAGVATTVVHSTLITSLVGVRDDSLRQGHTWSTLIPGHIRDSEEDIMVAQTIWITVSVTPSSEDSKPAFSPTTRPVTVSPSVPGSAIQALAVSTRAPAALPQLVDGTSSFNPDNPCPPKTDPLDQQSSSFESCKKTIAPSGICCIPFQAAPSTVLSSPTSNTPASTSASPTSISPSPIPSSSTTNSLSSSSSTSSSFSSSSSFSTSSSSLVPSTFSTSPTPPPTPPTDAPATNPTTIPPMPSELTTAKTKIGILPILIPCALAAVGIVALSIGCVIWRGKGKRHSMPPPPPDMGPKVVNGKKVFQAGNFAGAEAFRPGGREMARKEREGFGEVKGKWKKGYRRYRDSGLPGSGLFGVTKVREISG